MALFIAICEGAGSAVMGGILCWDNGKENADVNGELPHMAPRSMWYHHPVQMSIFFSPINYFQNWEVLGCCILSKGAITKKKMLGNAGLIHTLLIAATCSKKLGKERIKLYCVDIMPPPDFFYCTPRSVRLDTDLIRRNQMKARSDVKERGARQEMKGDCG